MPIDLEKIYVEFHMASRAVFFQLSRKFQKDVRAINRLKDENVFQQQQARYTQALKIRLEDLAIGVMDKYKDVRIADELRTSLTGYIKSYLNEFLQKTKFL